MDYPGHQEILSTRSLYLISTNSDNLMIKLYYCNE